MTIKASGPITLSDIIAEFGGGTPKPTLLSKYYRGKGLVADTAANIKIPTTGLILLSDFYGAANYTPGSNQYSAGTYTWVVPSGVTQVTLDLLGAGGGGSGGSDGGYVHNGPGGYGGYAGQYSAGNVLVVVPGDVLTIVVGAGGANGSSSCNVGNAGGYGGNTVVLKNGVQVLAVAGGAGGEYHAESSSFFGSASCGGSYTPSHVTSVDATYDGYSFSCPNGGTLNTNSYPPTCDTTVIDGPTHYYGPTVGHDSALGAGGMYGGTNSPGAPGGWGAGGGGGGCVSGSCVGSAYGGAGGSGFVNLAW